MLIPFAIQEQFINNIKAKYSAHNSTDELPRGRKRRRGNTNINTTTVNALPGNYLLPPYRGPYVIIAVQKSLQLE